MYLWNSYLSPTTYTYPVYAAYKGNNLEFDRKSRGIFYMPYEDVFASTLVNINFWESTVTDTPTLNSIIQAQLTFPNNNINMFCQNLKAHLRVICLDRNSAKAFDYNQVGAAQVLLFVADFTIGSSCMLGFWGGATQNNHFQEMGYYDFLIVKTRSQDGNWACVGVINKYTLTFSADYLVSGVNKDIKGINYFQDNQFIAVQQNYLLVFEVTTTPTINLLYSWNTGLNLDGPVTAIPEYNLAAIATNGNSLTFIEISTNTIFKTFASNLIETKQIQANPSLGIIYFSDSNNDLFALSYICKDNVGFVNVNGLLKDIHTCLPGQCSLNGSNLIYSAPNCIANCAFCMHLGSCVTACPEYYSCAPNKVCIMDPVSNYCHISCRKCNINFVSTGCTECPINYFLNFNNPMGPRDEFENGECISSWSSCIAGFQLLYVKKQGTPPYPPDIVQDINQCVSTCPTSWWIDAVTKICYPCDPTCLTCYGFTSSNCLSCPVGNYLNFNVPAGGRGPTDDGICVSTSVACTFGYQKLMSESLNATLFANSGQTITEPQNIRQCSSNCPSGSYADGSNVCMACDISCLTCVGGSLNQCTLCNSDITRYMNFANQIVRGVGAIGTCVTAVEFCDATYQNLYISTLDALILANQGFPGPSQQQNINQCVSSCPSGSFRNSGNGVCTNCNTDCNECNGPLNYHCLICETVNDGVLNSHLDFNPPTSRTSIDSGWCVDAPSNCLNLGYNYFYNQGLDATIQANTGYPPSQVQDIDQCVNNCPIGSTSDGSNICQACHITCLLCNNGVTASDCTLCQIGTYLNFNNPFLRTSSDIGNCVADSTGCSASQLFIHSQGLDGQILLNSGQSHFQVQDIDQCATQCSPGSYTDASNICIVCDPSCFLCIGGGLNDCTKCTSLPMAELYLDFNIPTNRNPGDTGKCVTSTSQCTSPYIYLYPAGLDVDLGQVSQIQDIGQCVQQCPNLALIQFGTNLCYNCDNCITCVGKQITNCLQCDSNQYLNFNNPQGTRDSTETGNCITFSNECTINYQYLYSTYLNSLLIAKGFSPSQTQNINQCVKQCPKGSFYDSSFLCTICNDKCKSCIGFTENDCLSCSFSQGLYINENLFPSPCLTDCGYRYYNGNNGGDGICIACDPSCLDCSQQPTMCTLCDASYLESMLFLHPASNKCLQECGVGYYEIVKVNTGYCYQCHSTCKECKNTNSELNCVSCEENHFLLDIILPQPCVIASKCGIQKYANILTGYCEKCNDTCRTCIGGKNTQCTSCQGDFYLYLSSNGISECVKNDDCGFHYFGGINNTCQICNETCLNCIFPGDSLNCLSCNETDNKTLYNGQCVNMSNCQYYKDYLFAHNTSYENNQSYFTNLTTSLVNIGKDIIYLESFIFLIVSPYSSLGYNIMISKDILNNVKYQNSPYPSNIKQVFKNNKNPIVIYKYNFEKNEENCGKVKDNYRTYNYNPYFLENAGDILNQIALVSIVQVALYGLLKIFNSKKNNKIYDDYNANKNKSQEDSQQNNKNQFINRIKKIFFFVSFLFLLQIIYFLYREYFIIQCFLNLMTYLLPFLKVSEYQL